MESLREGKREFVLLAPEQLAKEEVLEELREAGVAAKGLLGESR